MDQRVAAGLRQHTIIRSLHCLCLLVELEPSGDYCLEIPSMEGLLKIRCQNTCRETSLQFRFLYRLGRV